MEAMQSVDRQGVHADAEALVQQWVTMQDFGMVPPPPEGDSPKGLRAIEQFVEPPSDIEERRSWRQHITLFQSEFW